MDQWDLFPNDLGLIEGRSFLRHEDQHNTETFFFVTPAPFPSANVGTL